MAKNVGIKKFRIVIISFIKLNNDYATINNAFDNGL